MQLTKSDKEKLASIGAAGANGLGRAFLDMARAFGATGDAAEREELANAIAAARDTVSGYFDDVANAIRGGN